MIKNITCIVCPRGCNMTANIDGENVTVTGFACPKGEKYGIDECISPVRTVTTIVRVNNREDTMLSVKTKNPISKNDIFKVMQSIRKTSVQAPIKKGDIIIPNLYGSDIIATKSID